jgi:hypothetical protein
MTMTLATMSEMVSFQEREQGRQWAALAHVRGHSFPDCMLNNGKEKDYIFLDMYGEPLVGKDGKVVKLQSKDIGIKTRFNKCLELHGVGSNPLWLNGIEEQSVEWYFKYLVDGYDKKHIRLDAGAMEWLKAACRYYVPRRIMWNKYEAYVNKDKSVFAGDKTIYRFMIAIVAENQIQSAAVEVGVAAAKKKFVAMCEKYIARIAEASPELAAEIQKEIDVIREELPGEIAEAFHQKLREWSEERLLPELQSVYRFFLADGEI